MNGIGIDNAHMAFDSDCFSQAIASTRRYLPDCTRLAATTAVDPPTEPAVCTRISGLPVAPMASAMNSSGIMTPSKKSGALPTTTASMSSKVGTGIFQRAVDGLAHQAVHRNVFALGHIFRLPGTEYRGEVRPCTGHQLFPSMTATRFCCSAGPLVACASTRPADPFQICWAAKPMRSRPATNIGLAASAPPDGLTFVLPVMPMASARIRCWWVKGAWISATSRCALPPVAALAEAWSTETR